MELNVTENKRKPPWPDAGEAGIHQTLRGSSDFLVLFFTSDP